MSAEGTHADGLKIKGYAAVREFALRFPEAHEDFPWGHCAIKVKKKIFVSLGAHDGGFTMSLKLTDSNFEALLLPFTEPTHYGMGKHGWVTSRFGAREKAPLAMLKAWVEESYRAIATKTVVAKLDADGLVPQSGRAKRKATRKASKKATKKKVARKKATTRKKPGTGSARAAKKAVRKKT